MKMQFNIFIGICIIHISNLTLVIVEAIISNNERQSTVKNDNQKNNEADFSTELKECIKLLSSNVVTLEVFKAVSKKLTNDIVKPLKDIKNLQLVNKHEVYNFADQIGNRNPEYIRDVSLYYFLDLDDPYIKLDNARDFLVHINCKIVRNLDNTITVWAYSHQKKRTSNFKRKLLQMHRERN
ncbi:uncharacterized protein LOC126896779 isoform X2 [Daktulosphaira vitifoliae]|uniref:uncharacterized protein LOC126896779 isoform X1 n=1 Tax=Daktulosphaira vitifoliae TaxID=58002 RepID=UPI0021AABACC|nr:uncharacterized protein LOC126896779 isoform X1 [Daktulosphaira vitifoliae]XP_050525825.1 uncharacterized protein LOC126896779 isoform X2 [Daktulosphaira vitifoliae]